MRDTLHKIVLCVLGVIAVVLSGCEDDGPPAFEDDGTYAFTKKEEAAKPQRVVPGGRLPISISVLNSGTATWKQFEVRLILPEQAPWSGGTLDLAEHVKPGESATFRGSLAAPTQPGLHTLNGTIEFKEVRFGDPIELKVEVTCSDGIFCNGEERFANGQCVPGETACDDKSDCTMDTCDEQARLCKHTATGACAVCQAGPSCTPDCTGKQCGADGCGSECGVCPSGQACAQAIFQCKPDTQAGTCRSPLPLLADGVQLIGDHTIEGDSSGGIHQVVPSCNLVSTAVETVYTFTTQQRVGLDARVSGYDTVLHLRRKRTADGAADCLDDAATKTVACNDDSSPPGDFGSRIAVALDPGTYYLIVDGFDAAQFGAFSLKVRFAADSCVPKCDGAFCGGSDGCGGNCGVCGDGQACVKGRCLPSPCTPQCDGRECGDDGCAGQCGFCPGEKLCVLATGLCQSFPECNHMKPSCSPGCAETEFCGTDCVCHPVSEPLPDLVVDEKRLKDEILFDTVYVAENSCAWVEECVTGTGRRRVLRFSVEAINQGFATMTLPHWADRPDLFTFSPCHGHLHFSSFVSYALLDPQGRTVLTSRKQADCIEDSQRIVDGPAVQCSRQFYCDNPGIQRGWSNLYGYGNNPDCQWLDITDVLPGDYQIQVTVNPSRAIQEMTLDNNTASVPVTIPPP